MQVESTGHILMSSHRGGSSSTKHKWRDSPCTYLCTATGVSTALFFSKSRPGGALSMHLGRGKKLGNRIATTSEVL